MSLLLFDGLEFTPVLLDDLLDDTDDYLVEHIDHIEEHADVDVRPSGLIVVREHRHVEDINTGMYL